MTLAWTDVTLAGSSSIIPTVMANAIGEGAVVAQANTLDTTAPTRTLTATGLSADNGTPGDFVTNIAAQTVTGAVSA